MRWSAASIALPDKSTIHLNAAAPASDLAFATVQGMLTPPTLFRATPDGAAAPIQALPAQFDASDMVVEQHFATSKDETKIPYFLVHRKDVRGPVPVLMHAYGGFELAQTPSYLVQEPYRSGPLALFWVEEGNAYVLANIRGGGEYGPRWHNAVLRENRQKAYDDLYSVAQDLIARNLTQKGRLAVSGRSNGGSDGGRRDHGTARPVGRGNHRIATDRHETLFTSARRGIVDGRVWKSDVPADWAFIANIRPIKTFAKKGVKYPVPFIYTSTRDDRVHPGHARKFAAPPRGIRRPLLLRRSIEGGLMKPASFQPKMRSASLLKPSISIWCLKPK